MLARRIDGRVMERQRDRERGTEGEGVAERSPSGIPASKGLKVGSCGVNIHFVHLYSSSVNFISTDYDKIYLLPY